MLGKVKGESRGKSYRSLILLFAFLASTITATAITAINPQTTRAADITQAQIDFCVKTYPAGTVITDGGVDKTNGQYVKNNCGLICTPETSGGESAPEGMDPAIYQKTKVLSCNAAATPAAPSMVKLADITNENDCVVNGGAWDTPTSKCAPKLPAEQQACKDSKGTWDPVKSECTGGTSAAASKPTCGVDGVGWIVCPVMGFIGKLTDAAFSLIANNFLTLETGLLDGAQPIWQQFRNIGNVVFVVAFIIIIYSQITGAGITNYGIKKLLPKLIIVAILVNLSFILCQLAVELSNFLGYSLNGFFANSILTTSDTTDTTNGWGPVLGGILAVGMGVGLVALAFSVPALIASFFAIIMILFILTARKALIILLIIVAPVAFAAYLLPNTESWFKKWWKMFFTLLVLFPVIGILFGASSLASSIISGYKGGGDYLWKVVALTVQALPLFAVPTLLKGSLSAMGSIGAKIGNMAGNQMSRSSKGFGDRFGESKAIIGQRAMNAGARIPGVGRIVTGKRRRDMKLSTLKAKGDSTWSGMVANEGGLQNLYGSSKDAAASTHENEIAQAKTYAKSILEGKRPASPAQKATAQSTLDELERKEAAAHAIALSGTDQAGLMKILDSSDTDTSGAEKAAALERLIKIKGPKEYEKYVEKYAGDDSIDTRIIRQKMAEGLSDSGMFKGSQISAMSEGTFKWGEDGNGASMKEQVEKNTEAGVVSAVKMSKMANDDLDYLSEAAEHNAAARAQLQKSATNLFADPTLRNIPGHTRSKIEKLEASGSTK